MKKKGIVGILRVFIALAFLGSMALVPAILRSCWMGELSR